MTKKPQIKHSWIQQEDNPEKVRNYLLNDTFILDKLKEICYNSIRSVEKVTTKDYETPSWPYLQAHNNGLVEAYKHIIELCTITERDE